MLINYIQQAMALFERADAIIICDKKGYIEYAKWYKDWYFSSAEVVGKHILEVYPTLTEETSTIMQCISRMESRLEEEQHIANFKGEVIVQSLFMVRREQERNWLQNHFIHAAAVGNGILSPKTVRPSQRLCWRGSFLEQKKGAIQELRPRRDCLNWRMGGLYFWMRLIRWILVFRQRY